jgi:ornithine decarboxylase
MPQTSTHTTGMSAEPVSASARSVLPSTERIDRYLVHHKIPTPFIIIDLNIVRERYQVLRQLFPHAAIFYAVKANPHAAVIGALAELGARFDLASEGEIHHCFRLDIAADRLSFGNTIKRETDIAHAHRNGIDLFAFDSAGELEKIANSAPGARVFCRILVGTRDAEWPLTRKFGCTPAMAVDLLLRARQLGLQPTGVSFHVGSQQINPAQWIAPIASAARIFRVCARHNVSLSLLNLGGGLPAHYRAAVPPLAAYADTIERALVRSFGRARPEIVIEPGRYLVGDAGLLRTQVLLIARKSRRASQRWVYLDAGRYNGLPETFGERIHYRIRPSVHGGPTEPAILAGPTCDSTDILYQRSGYNLPLDLKVGHTIDFLSAGAYTASYASVEFNGFAPIQMHCF